MPTAPEPTPELTPFQRFAAGYKSCALVSFNTAVLLLLLNLLLQPLLHLAEARRADPVSTHYAADKLDQVYPDLSRQERGQLLAETFAKPQVFEDFVHFKEKPVVGQYVNVAEAGYRLSKNQGPWPPDPKQLNVFVFGGSTAFGFGLPDEQTLASCLQDALAPYSPQPVRVYNFACSWYFSTQERLRFEQLLLAGHVPQVALFINGLNDCFTERPMFAENLEQFFDQGPPGTGTALLTLARTLPVARAASALRPPPPALTWPTEADEVLDRRKDRYLFNLALCESACRLHGVAPVFVWQPAPGYGYDMSRHLFASPEQYRNVTYLYGALAETLKAKPLGPSFLWCADLTAQEGSGVYLDRHHYTAAFSKRFAEHIARLCAERGLLPGQGK